VNPLKPSFTSPWILWGAWLFLCCLAFYKPLLTLIRYALQNDDASHIVLIPFLVAWLLYTDRQKLLRGSLDLVAASWFAVPASVLVAISIRSTFADATVSLAVSILALVMFSVAGFVGLFGRGSANSMRFPLAFLLFMVPLPGPLLAQIIQFLQAGSAAVAELIFDWTGTPALREGFVFHLPKMSIEVAQECSGIRSSIALLILALLVAHFAFSKFWKKALFVAVGLVMMIVKNGVRIATLTILANSVNPEFLYGKLHREGGIVFFLIGIALLLPVYWYLHRSERSIPPDKHHTAL
jgi:exosortase